MKLLTNAVLSPLPVASSLIGPKMQSITLMYSVTFFLQNCRLCDTVWEDDSDYGLV
jgi:hypothetical protein